MWMQLRHVEGMANLKRMKAFYAEYPVMPEGAKSVQQPVVKGKTKVPQRLAQMQAAAGQLDEKVPQLAALLA